MLVGVGIPTIDGKVHANTLDSLVAETLLGFNQGVHFLPVWEFCNGLIHVARTRIAHKFLESKADCLVFVDSDISWKGGDLIRLASRPEDVIGGTYRTKTEEVVFHVRGAPQKHGDVLKVEGVPTGFLKISRRAFETIDAEPYRDGDGVDRKFYFPTGVLDGELWGEDYGFCRLWRKSGGDVFLDPSLRVRHHDGPRTYDGDVLEWLNGADH